MGMDAIITDYLPERRGRILHAGAMTLLWLVTGTTIYGLWQLNANDKGIGETVRSVWGAKSAVAELSQ